MSEIAIEPKYQRIINCMQFSPKKQLPYVILSHSWFFEKIFAEILEFLKKLLQFRFGLHPTVILLAHEIIGAGRASEPLDTCPLRKIRK